MLPRLQNHNQMPCPFQQIILKLWQKRRLLFIIFYSIIIHNFKWSAWMLKQLTGTLCCGLIKQKWIYFGKHLRWVWCKKKKKKYMKRTLFQQEEQPEHCGRTMIWSICPVNTKMVAMATLVSWILLQPCRVVEREGLGLWMMDIGTGSHNVFGSLTTIGAMSGAKLRYAFLALNNSLS